MHGKPRQKANNYVHSRADTHKIYACALSDTVLYEMKRRHAPGNARHATIYAHYATTRRAVTLSVTSVGG